jgi:hypothetical protein
LEQRRKYKQRAAPKSRTALSLVEKVLAMVRGGKDVQYAIRALQISSSTFYRNLTEADRLAINRARLSATDGNIKPRSSLDILESLGLNY